MFTFKLNTTSNLYYTLLPRGESRSIPLMTAVEVFKDNLFFVCGTISVNTATVHSKAIAVLTIVMLSKKARQKYRFEFPYVRVSPNVLWNFYHRE